MPRSRLLSKSVTIWPGSERCWRENRSCHCTYQTKLKLKNRVCRGGKREELKSLGGRVLLFALSLSTSNDIARVQHRALLTISNKGRRGVRSREVLTTPSGLISFAQKAKN